MSSLQDLLLGVMIAWTPSLVFLACILGRGPRRFSEGNRSSMRHLPE
jgi:hypothetical protein